MPQESVTPLFQKTIHALSTLSTGLGNEAPFTRIPLDLVIFEMKVCRRHTPQTASPAALIREAIGLVNAIGKQNVAPAMAMMSNAERETKEMRGILAREALENLFELAQALIAEG